MVEEFVSDSLEHPLPFVLHDAANSGKYSHTITSTPYKNFVWLQIAVHAARIILG